MNLNASNKLNAGEIVFTEGDVTGYFMLVLKGKLQLYTRGISCIVGPGTVIGSDDERDIESICSARALEEAVVYAFSSKNENALRTVLSSNKDYSGLAVYNYAKIIQELSRQKENLFAKAEELTRVLKDSYSEYMKAAKASELRANMIPEITRLSEFAPEENIGKERVIKALEYAKIPYDVMKNYYTCSMTLTLDTVYELRYIQKRLIEACNEASDYVHDSFRLLVGNPDYSLFRSALCLGIDMKKKNVPTDTVEEIAGICLGQLTEIKALETRCTGRNWDIEEKAIEGLKDAFLTGRDFRTSADSNSSELDTMVVEGLESLQNSFEQLLEFGRYPDGKKDEFRALMDAYIAMPDKESADDEYRKLRRDLAECFYLLYTGVFFASVSEPVVPKAAELMLNYGFLSEKLLKDEELAELLRIKTENVTEPCTVHTMRGWLRLIYEKRREPSRNDMGQDYAEVIREMKKTGAVSANDEKAVYEDPEKRVEYEIKNVMAHGNRIVNGQLSTFVPILHSDQFIGEIGRAYCSADAVNEAVKKLLEIDYSVFYRESLFVDPAHGVEKDIIVKEVFPEMILYPTVGQNVIMWQEITGRKRDSEGRFFVPCFSYSSLKDMMVKAFGQFRWALCKTIQGTAWNDIKVHSLTSEYSDYIQFYKKNHELSDERKEKLKLQIQRGRNNLREIFTIDYVLWIRGEAMGAMKLNKVAREILATNCPFAEAIREPLCRQPVYEEAYARFNREKNKKVHETELKMKAIESKKFEVPQEIRQTLCFYRDM